MAPLPSITGPPLLLKGIHKARRLATELPRMNLKPSYTIALVYSTYNFQMCKSAGAISRKLSYFHIIAAPVSNGNDLTGGVALPMFRAPWGPLVTLQKGEKALISLGYHEACSSGIAGEGEDDQQISGQGL
jgi:hypothetical protein